MQSNTIQSNSIRIPRPKSYLNPNLKKEKKTKQRLTGGGYGSDGLSLYFFVFASLYLRISIPLGPFIVTGGNSLYLLHIARIFSSPPPFLYR